jgi:subtilisin family serine protease
MLVAASLAGPAPGASPAGATRVVTSGATAYVPHQVLVRYRAGVDEATMAGVEGRFGATTLKSFHIVPGLRLLQLGERVGVPAALAGLRADPRVLYAQPNWIVRLDEAVQPRTIDKTPDDPRYGAQWDWPKIDAPKAWNRTTGSRKVVVGDIDTGIDYNHEDLAANVWQNTAECNGVKGVDDDHNGYVDDCHGIDTINGDSDPMDDNGHGTHTGGTIGAVGNNGIGVTGFNWKVQVLPCKSHASDGNGTPASIIECYQYMVDEKAAGYDIIATNNSYGGCPEACEFDRATRDGIRGLDKAGILFAVSAGNESADNDVTPKYPTNYFLPNIISTAATTLLDRLASFSNHGDRTVMVGAPGTNVMSTEQNDTYGRLSGTSMAAPHVAGLAALLHAFDPSLNIYQIRNLILAGGDDIASLDGKTVSGKRINANGSMECSNQRLFAMLRPLDTVPLKRQRIAALNIDCADGAGGISVKIKPGNLLKFKLKDNGTRGDIAANDGIYSRFWTPEAKGTYTLTFSNGEVYTVVVA